MNLESISRRTLFAASAALLMSTAVSSVASGQTTDLPLIVDLEWLRTQASEPDLRVLDVAPLHVFRSGHIDGAEHAWWRDTVDPNYPVFGAVLTQGDEQAHRQQVMDTLSLFDDDRVVVYDNEDGFRAARLVWFLRFLGFDQVALLDAGAAARSAGDIAIHSASTSSTRPTVNPQDDFYLVTDQLRTRLSTGDVQLIDIRTDAERADDLNGAMPLGQIPGSVRLPWDQLIDDSGLLIPAAELRQQTAALGLDLTRQTVLYGSFGVDTALSWLMLRDAGFTDVLSYDRGWAEWSTLPDLPREALS